MRPVILLDVDGPLTDGFFHTICDAIREEGVEARADLITQWDVCRSFGLTPEQTARVYARMRAPGVAASFEPRDGAHELVTSLRRWARVVAVTAPLDGSPTWADEREVWLTDYLDFGMADVVSARDKTLVRGDVLVDDKCISVRSWSEEWGREAILWGESHNARDAWSPRASDYFELLGLLNKLKEGR